MFLTSCMIEAGIIMNLFVNALYPNVLPDDNAMKLLNRLDFILTDCFIISDYNCENLLEASII